MADSAAAYAAVATGDLPVARQRLQSAADGYGKVGHIFWAHRTLAQMNAVGIFRRRNVQGSCFTNFLLDH